jgi:hypothetical protein
MLFATSGPLGIKGHARRARIQHTILVVIRPNFNDWASRYQRHTRAVHRNAGRPTADLSSFKAQAQFQSTSQFEAHKSTTIGQKAQKAHSSVRSRFASTLSLGQGGARRRRRVGLRTEPPEGGASEMEAGLRLRALGHHHYYCGGGFKRGWLAAARGERRQRRVGAASCSPALCSRAWRELRPRSPAPLGAILRGVPPNVFAAACLQSLRAGMAMAPRLGQWGAARRWCAPGGCFMSCWFRRW